MGKKKSQLNRACGLSAVDKSSDKYKYPGQKKFGDDSYRVSRRGGVQMRKGGAGKWVPVPKSQRKASVQNWADKWVAKLRK